jgi:uroporphyrinogen-III synthase
MEEHCKQFNVILLKTGDQLAKNDKYIEHLKSSNISHKFKQISQINLLKFEFCNLSVIREKLADFFLSNGTEKQTAFSKTNYRSLIITSRQTVESIEAAFEKEFDVVKHLDLLPELLGDSQLQNTMNHETKLFVYCVGQATFSRFKEMLRKFKHLSESIDKNVCIRSVTEGKQNALELSRLVIQDRHDLFSQDGNTFAFYPCSSIRKDELSTELTKNGVSFEEITAYKTAHSEAGLNELYEMLLKHLTDENPVNFLVFFSPSGCDALFEDQSQKNKLDDLIRNNISRIRLLSIGPSTSAKLKIYFPDLFNVSVFELDEPSPRALLDRLNSF